MYTNVIQYFFRSYFLLCIYLGSLGIQLRLVVYPTFSRKHPAVAVAQKSNGEAPPFEGDSLRGSGGNFSPKILPEIPARVVGRSDDLEIVA